MAKFYTTKEGKIISDPNWAKSQGWTVNPTAYGTSAEARQSLSGGQSTTPTSPTQTPTSPTSSYQGSSIVDYLRSVGQGSSFGERTGLAGQHGIQNYTGSAQQNLSLLGMLRGGQQPTAPTATSPTSPVSQFAPTPTPTPSPTAGMFTGAPPQQGTQLSDLFGGLIKQVSGRIGAAPETSRAEELFGQLQTAQAGRGSALDILKRHREEQGIAGLEGRILPINQQIRETENILGKVEGDIRTETGGEVTESQRLASVAQREKPLRGRLGDLFTQRAPMQEELQNKMALVQQFSDIEVQEAQQEVNDIFDLIRANPQEDPSGQIMNDLSMISELLSIESSMRPEIQDLDTQVVEINGRKVLVNRQTGETVKDLGAITPRGGGGGGGSLYDQFDLLGGEDGQEGGAPSFHPPGTTGGAEYDAALQQAAQYLSQLRDQGQLTDEIKQSIISQFVGGLWNTAGNVSARIDRLMG